MSDEQKNDAEIKLESIPEEAAQTTETKVEDEVLTPQVKKEMVKQTTREKTPPKITSQTEDEELKSNRKRNQVNKKLSTMSKNTKEKQKNKPLVKPTTTIPQGSLSKLLNISPMYLLGIIGVLIAGISLWYQRKSYLSEEEGKADSERDDQSPKKPSGGGIDFFGPMPDDLRGEGSSPIKKGKGKTSHKGMDPFEWKEHQLGVWNFDD